MAVDINGITQLATLLVSVLAIIWHQQRSNDKLRREFHEDNRELRREFRRENRKLRREFRREHAKLHADHGELRRAFERLAEIVVDNGRKLARIEGFLGIGMPDPAAASAPGAAMAATPHDPPDAPPPPSHDPPGVPPPPSHDTPSAPPPPSHDTPSDAAPQARDSG